LCFRKPLERDGGDRSVNSGIHIWQLSLVAGPSEKDDLLRRSVVDAEKDLDLMVIGMGRGIHPPTGESPRREAVVSAEKHLKRRPDDQDDQNADKYPELESAEAVHISPARKHEP
jgi:hypothetical protein